MPYESDAQRRYFNANKEELEAQGVDVDEWNESSRGKDLPERKKKKKEASFVKRILPPLEIGKDQLDRSVWTNKPKAEREIDQLTKVASHNVQAAVDFVKASMPQGSFVQQQASPPPAAAAAPPQSAGVPPNQAPPSQTAGAGQPQAAPPLANPNNDPIPWYKGTIARRENPEAQDQQLAGLTAQPVAGTQGGPKMAEAFAPVFPTESLTGVEFGILMGKLAACGVCVEDKAPIQAAVDSEHSQAVRTKQTELKHVQVPQVSTAAKSAAYPYTSGLSKGRKLVPQQGNSQSSQKLTKPRTVTQDNKTGYTNPGRVVAGQNIEGGRAYPTGKMAEDQMPGGLADNMTNSDFNRKSLIQGRNVESEHTGDQAIADEIARDHLAEDPEYYDKLEEVEKSSEWLEALYPVPFHKTARFGKLRAMGQGARSGALGRGSRGFGGRLGEAAGNALGSTRRALSPFTVHEGKVMGVKPKYFDTAMEAAKKSLLGSGMFLGGKAVQNMFNRGPFAKPESEGYAVPEGDPTSTDQMVPSKPKLSPREISQRDLGVNKLIAPLLKGKPNVEAGALKKHIYPLYGQALQYPKQTTEAVDWIHGAVPREALLNAAVEQGYKPEIMPQSQIDVSKEMMGFAPPKGTKFQSTIPGHPWTGGRGASMSPVRTESGGYQQGQEPKLVPKHEITLPLTEQDRPGHWGLPAVLRHETEHSAQIDPQDYMTLIQETMKPPTRRNLDALEKLPPWMQHDWSEERPQPSDKRRSADQYAHEFGPSLADMVFMGESANRATGKPLQHTVNFPSGDKKDIQWMLNMARRHGLLTGNKTMTQLLAENPHFMQQMYEMQKAREQQGAMQ